jgi:hypothetical protein
MFKTTPHKETVSSTAIEPVNFSIGTMTNTSDATHEVVAILLDRGPAATKAVMLEDWTEVLEVVATLLQSATNLWGPPPADEGHVLEIPLDPRH